MNPVFKKWLISLSTRIVIIVIVVKAMVLGLLWFLPSEGVDYYPEHSLQAKYHRYTLDSMLDKGQAGSASAQRVSATQMRSTLVLKGLYGSKRKGFVIVAPEKTPTKTEVIAVGEQFGGNRLVQINPQSAIFERSGRRYVLQMENVDARLSSKGTGAAERDDVPRSVSRSNINYYVKDIDKVWKDIGITELKEGKKITGFKVTRIKPSSPMAELGLRRGDVIIKANNKTLTSYADVLAIYKKIGTMQALELVVLRNNQEKEIIYEIY
ncbi:MAG: PDZ domain-containing protein [Campylobacterota bacterium]|nr:PDZ domain-containing protein [Campylobacterota bacterium]